MGEVHVHEFMSIDGAMDEPTWTFDYGFDPTMGERIGAVCENSDAILLGRNTYEMFEPAWSTRTVEDDPGAPFFNDTKKYVVSSTLPQGEGTWSNSEIIGGYDPAAIQKLKDAAGNLFVSGSRRLVQGMLKDGLIDELHLCVFPLSRGGDIRLFEAGTDDIKLSLQKCESFPNGVVYLNYRKA